MTAKKTSTKKRPRSLVTGACGFIGSHVVETLHAAGHEIIATDLADSAGEDDLARGRFPSVLKNLGVELHPSDMTAPRTLAPLVEDLDYVFHVASIFSYTVPWEALHAVNVEGTRNLLELLLERSPNLKRHVQWGAGGVYGMPRHRTGPYTEDMAPAPTNDYLRSKWFQEHLVMTYGRERGLPWTIIRPTTVYGPRAVYGGGVLLLEAAKMNPAIAPRNFDFKIPFIHVRDVAGAALHLAQHEDARNEIFHTNDDTIMSNVEFFRFMAELSGNKFILGPAVPIGVLRGVLSVVASASDFLKKKGIAVPIPLETDTVAFFGEDFAYANEKLKATGYDFLYPDAREGIRDTMDWYRDNGWI